MEKVTEKWHLVHQILDTSNSEKAERDSSDFGKHARTRLMDLTARGYQAFLRVFRKTDESIRRKCIDLARLRGDEAVLDAGCGPGSLSARLAPALPDGKVNACDISARMVSIASKKVKRFGSAVELEVGDLRELPYPDRSFEVVFTNLTFHHLDSSEKFRAVGEIYRVLKPGGAYVSAELDSESNGPLKRFLSMGPRTLDPGDLLEAGFDVEREIDSRTFALMPIVYRLCLKPGTGKPAP
jgi:SAM-dependent methyltransferase